MLAGLAFEFDHHDSDVVGTTTVEGLEDDALGAKMRLIQALPDEADGLFVAEGVPQPVGRQDHELRLQLVQVKGHDVGIGNDHVEVFQGVVAKRARHGQDPLDSPGTIETDEASLGARQNVKFKHSVKTEDKIVMFFCFSVSLFLLPSIKFSSWHIKCRKNFRFTSYPVTAAAIPLVTPAGNCSG